MRTVSAFLQFLLFGLAIYIAFNHLQPSINSSPKETEFSVDKAMKHVRQMAQEPHYTGSSAHSVVRNYLISALEEMGLSPHVQQGFSATYSWGLNIAVPENIVAKINGKNPEAPALVLMSHYDSAVHSSYGAADAASGIAAILESLRAFLAQDQQPEQDLIILFTDTEEVGLIGANLFIQEHPWADNIGLAINLEARGSAGPSSMILEVNEGNKNLISHFAKANIANPFANSLMYSVYKLLPNDTDSTIFREEGDIPSFFFAFIDDHFNYHTALDTAENLSLKSLNQQGEYALSLINYFSNHSLTDLNSKTEHVYFNFPFFGIIHFSLGFALFLIIFSFASLFLLTYIGIKQEKIFVKSLLKSFLFSLITLVLVGLFGFYGWKLFSNLYPEYKLILQGYPYNGFSYTLAFLSFATALFFWAFQLIAKKWNAMNLLPVAIFIWLLISFMAYLYLPGASYLVIPALGGLLSLFTLVCLKTNSQSLHFLYALPVLFLIVPFLTFFPVGLGISSIFISLLLCVLILLLISPLLFNYYALKGVAFLLFCTGLFFMGKAHINADFNTAQPRPSSLVYCHDVDENASFWASYDERLSSWNAAYFDTHAELTDEINFESKYATRFKHFASAAYIPLPKSSVYIEEVDKTDTYQRFRLTLSPNRKTNRYEAYFDRPLRFTDVLLNGKEVGTDVDEKFIQRNTRFFNYYVANQESLELEFTVHTAEDFSLKIYESAFDLLSHPMLDVTPRPDIEIPMPFVLNDATIITYTVLFQ